LEDPKPADARERRWDAITTAAAAPVTALAATLDFDAALDRSATFEARFLVVSERPSDEPGARRRTDLPPTPDRLAAQPSELFPLPFHLARYDEDRVVAGRTWIVIRMRSGAFGIPWFPPNVYRIEQDEG
jgi:hypothetical protein